MDVCPKCALPKELCTCTQMAMEGQVVKVFTAKRRYGKPVTLIKGIDFEELGQEKTRKLVKDLKKEHACGGTFDRVEKAIELQGSHAGDVKSFLRKLGYKVEGNGEGKPNRRRSGDR